LGLLLLFDAAAVCKQGPTGLPPIPAAAAAAPLVKLARELATLSYDSSVLLPTLLAVASHCPEP
jgi:hypothetical protein